MDDNNQIIKKKKNSRGVIGIVVACLTILSVVIIVILVSFFVVGSSSRKLHQQLDLGDKYITELDYDNAIIAYEKAIEIDPDSEEAYIGLANAYIELIDLAMENFDNNHSEESVKYITDLLNKLIIINKRLMSEEISEKILSIQKILDENYNTKEPEDNNDENSIDEKSNDEIGKLLVKQSWYDKDGNVFQWYEYEYDETGRKIKTISQSGISECEYDNQGNLIKEGNTAYTYDNEGRQTGRTITDDNGVPYFVEITQYYDKSETTSWTQTMPDGTTSVRVSTALYENGLISERNTNDGDGNRISYEYYQYDNDGKLIENDFYDASTEKCTSVFKYYYDTDGDLIQVDSLNDKGEVVNKIVYEYE